MSPHSKLALSLSVVAVVSVTALWSRDAGDVVNASGGLARSSDEGPPARAVGGPSADAFAARVEELLPRMELLVAAGAARSSDLDAEMCARNEAIRVRELEDIARALFDDERLSSRTDDDASALAAPLVDAVEPLRRCLSCGPRSGCADAARALVRGENVLRAYQVRRSGT